MAYEIRFVESVAEHFAFLSAGERARVIDGIEKHLAHEPTIETRNRKPLRPNPLAPWELRLGALRVFYEVCTTDRRVVRVLAVGRKQRNVLMIAGQEIRQ